MSDYILECKNLVKSYGKKEALKGIDLTIEKGRIVGLLGPNGSGKSTLLKLAAVLIIPSSWGSQRTCELHAIRHPQA